MTESTNGWAYFAKQEYDPTLAPSALYVYDIPCPISLTFNPNPAANGTYSVGTVTVNGLGPRDSVTVTISPGTYVVGGNGASSYSLVITSLNNPATFTVWSTDGSLVGGWYWATCDNVGIATFLQ
jgi:hypothetical protein